MHLMIRKNNCKLFPELRMPSLFVPPESNTPGAPAFFTTLSKLQIHSSASSFINERKLNSALSAWMDGWICTMVI